MRILVLGGSKFFGKRLAHQLVEQGHDLTLLNRGHLDEGLGNRVQRLKCDRTDPTALAAAVKGKSWDVIYDQVCFRPQEAAAAVEIFSGKVGRYIFTSSQAVYGLGANWIESDFDPLTYNLPVNLEEVADYGESKRRCEAVLTQSRKFPVVCVRPSIVIGFDDPTNRLQNYLTKIQKGEPVYFMNSQVELSLVSADDAAQTLAYLLGPRTSEFVGPLNLCSPDPIRLDQLMALMARTLGKQVYLTESEDDKQVSPYGVPSDWTMSASKLMELGYTPAPISQWLPIEVKKFIQMENQ